MQSLITEYHPITGTPFEKNEYYREIPPCDALKPFVRCFWGTEYPAFPSDGKKSQGIVIPDTCMDIIFNVNYSRNCTDGYFCTLDERSFRTSSDTAYELTSTFAIRFYAWTAILFSAADFKGRKNSAFPIEEFFPCLKQQLEPFLFELPSINQKIAVTEGILLKMLSDNFIDSDMMNAVHLMLKTKGKAQISDISSYTAVSERQLERIFNLNMGISPKSFSSLLRYQLLWQEMLFSPCFNILDAVEKYGYTDQAHLINDFKRRHLMTPREAVKHAYKSR